jgi:putative transposase
MITPDHDLAITRQAVLLALSRSSVYYTPRPVSDEDLALMRRMDELHLELPFAGSRMLRDLLNDDLGGHLKSGHRWTLQNRPPHGAGPRLEGEYRDVTRPANRCAASCASSAGRT